MKRTYKKPILLSAKSKLRTSILAGSQGYVDTNINTSIEDMPIEVRARGNNMQMD